MMQHKFLKNYNHNDYNFITLAIGIEPMTTRLTVVCSTKLSYTSHNQNDYGLKYQTFFPHRELNPDLQREKL